MRVENRHPSSVIIPILVLSVFGLLVACANPTSSAPITLSNGYVVSAQEQARLESLRPGYLKAVSGLIGADHAKALENGEDVKLDVDASTLMQTIRDYMKATLGDDYEKYIITGRNTKVVPVEIVATPTNGARWVYVPSGEDGAYQYQMGCNSFWAIWPWGSYNAAETAADAINKATGSRRAWTVYYIAASVQDSSTTDFWGSSMNAHIQTTYGSLRSGFFPPPPSALLTTHRIIDATVLGGSVTASFYWG